MADRGRETLRIAPGFELPLEVVTEASAIVATRGAGKSSTSAVITEEVFELGVQVVIFDRTGVYWGLRSNGNGDGPGLGIYVLGGPHGDVPLEPHAGALIADLVVESGHSFVLDLSDFSKSAAIRFAADFLERLYDRKARARSTTLLVLDEAHFYAPQTPRGGFKGDSARLMGAMEDVVGLGRSRGLGVVLTTQRTQALNKAILDLIETLLVMRMLSPRARDAVQDWIREKHEDDREGVIETLDALPTGTAWVWSPLRGLLQKVAIRRIRTFDSYATPKPGETRVEPTTRRELDLDALGEQMRETAERAKADDPAELRKRIRELEQALAEQPREVTLEVVPAEAIESVKAAYLKFDQVDTIIGNANEILSGAMRAIEVAVRAHGLDLNLDGDAPRFVEIEGFRPVGSERAITPAGSEVASGPATARAAADRGSRMSERNGEGHTPSRSPAGGRSKADPGSAGKQPGSSVDARKRILDALAWLAAARISPASRLQVAMVAGYHPRTNAFTAGLAELIEAGHVTYPRAGWVALTISGSAQATHPGHAPSSSRELQQMILRQVGGLRAEILAKLLEEDGPLSRNELAEKLDYHPRTNAFTGAIGSLKNLGLVSFPRAGQLEPSQAMYLR